MNASSGFVFLLWLVSNLADAAPTVRPLPPGIVDENKDFRILRDSKEKSVFFAVPKRMVIYENALQPYGRQQSSCEAVSEYYDAQKAVIKAKKDHAEISQKRAELLKGILTKTKALLDEQTDLLIEKRKLESELQGIGEDEAKKAKVKARLTEVDKWLSIFSDQLARIKEIQGIAEKEQGEVIKQVENLEKSLETFEGKVSRPAAKVRIRMRIPQQDLKDATFRKSMGFSENDSLSLPKLISLSLFPLKTDGNILERLKIGETVGVYEPEWSAKPLELREADFGLDELSSSIEQVDFPTELYFEQILSLLTYCAVRDTDYSKQLVLPLRVSFAIAAWVDERVTTKAGSELLSYRSQFNDEEWKQISVLPARAELRVTSPDLGNPDNFNNKGVYQAKPFSLSLPVQAEKQEDK